MRTEPTPPTARSRAGHASLIACIALLMGTQAQAQTVQKCRIDGRLVFQSGPCPLEPRAAAASAPTSAEAASAPAKKTLAEIMSERAASNRARATETEAQGDGANVLRAKMGAL
jgi:hypothetical protein